MSMNDAVDRIGEVGVVPVVTVGDVDSVVPLVETLVAGGLTAVEITLRTEHGLAAISRIVAEVPGAMVGAGSVTNPAQVEQAARAGAQFLVAPGFDDESVRAAAAVDSLIIPGVGTATELMRAVDVGLDTLKVFPAAPLGGPDVIKAFAAVWPGVRFMPTGGIDAATAPDYLAIAQVIAVGGSWMLPASSSGSIDRASVFAEAQRAAALGRNR